ncbi:hypothetical protein EGW08_020576 [Elysia chlorotica]|uniref:Uncharacterized protein n=1 Tax=Elysia chlorotica TaxID=188477 RepID=A0A3S1H3U5_ELYCH|nr:hypothetical protein EGW08_020576 [Elysia chlorotica]
MASRIKEDRFSSRYFKDLQEFELSSGEDSESEVDSGTGVNVQTSETESKQKVLNVASKPVEQKEKSETKTDKLPSALDCLKPKSSPAFLRLNKQKEVDWNKSAISLDKPESEPVDFKPNAVPPPTSYEPVVTEDSETKDGSKGDKRKAMDQEAEDHTPAKAYKVHKAEDEDV